MVRLELHNAKELQMTRKEPAEVCLQIAKRLTAVRLQKTWTRETLAREAGVNIHTLKRFERGGQISLERLVALCEALDMRHELERVFKPRARVDVDNWQVNENQPTRQRGKRRARRDIDSLLAETVEQLDLIEA